MKKGYYSIIVFAINIVIVLCLSCAGRIPETYGYLDYLALPNAWESNVDSLQVSACDTVLVKVDFEIAPNSMYGRFFMKSDTLCFADTGTNTIMQYDMTGRFIRRSVSNGRGPNEILGATTASVAPSGEVLIMNGWYIYFFDGNWHKTSGSYLDFNSQNFRIDELIKHPNPFLSDIYEVALDWLSVRLYNNHYAIFPVTTEHVRYNGYQGNNVNHFFANSYIFGICDLNGSSVGLFGHYSPWHYENYAQAFSGVLFDVVDDCLYYTFEADSLIYLMDIPSRSLMLSFGVTGKDMCQNYKSYSSFDEVENHYYKDNSKYGHYDDLGYEHETGLLFRTYYPGNDSPYDYIQVYDNFCMVCEVRVPRYSYYIGYSDGWSYFTSSEPDTDNESFEIYRFRFAYQ